MNLTPSADAPFGNEEAFNDFLGNHEVAHNTIALYLQRAGKNMAVYPLSQSPIENSDWLLDHNQMHQQIAQLSGLIVPDLSEVNFKNEEEFSDWMLAHAQVHEQINQTLGINT